MCHQTYRGRCAEDDYVIVKIYSEQLKTTYQLVEFET